MNGKTLTAIALVLALALAAATAKPNEPAGKEVAVPAVAPVEMNLGVEWKVQFEDLRVQIAEHLRLLDEMARKKHVLENVFGPDPRLRDLLAQATVMRGRLKGQKLARNAFLSPALSYDARTILFAYAEKQGNAPHWSEGRSFHIFKIKADGTQLEQLTDGPWNDLLIGTLDAFLTHCGV